VEPRKPAERPPDKPHHIFKRGRSYPRAIAWLGFSSFWGHLWHLAASVVATEDIDARDWMAADPPERLTERCAEHLGGQAAASLTEGVSGDLWVDFIADSGDDRDVSSAVADLLFRSYQLPGVPGVDSGQEILAPRGDVLLFGGDTAYPVATDIEVHNRVCIPFNKVLQERDDGKPRVLLGIPGNHDWYDGLDGFARMFRARRGKLDRSVVDDCVDTGGAVGHFFDWVEAFRVGNQVVKRKTLPLIGYTPLQNSSYFCLKLAPYMDLWGIDRQLRGVDFTQRSYFFESRSEAPRNALVLAIADPVFAMLEPNPIGQGIIDSLEVGFEQDKPLVLTGDTHHYCRQNIGEGMHIIAGGGGAFLHPARIARSGFAKPAAEFPGPRASFALAMQVPWQIAGGRAGFVVHSVYGLLYLPLLVLHLHEESTFAACLLITGLSTIACALIGGWRKRDGKIIVLLSLLAGIWSGVVPYGIRHALHAVADGQVHGNYQAVLGWLLSIYPATLGFGTFLMVLTLLGLEQHQAFSALANPGYKHFLRLRIRQDGKAIDGWVVGKVDTLDPEAPTVLVDHFTWPNPQHPDYRSESTPKSGPRSSP
jgi:hypothetical protein